MGEHHLSMYEDLGSPLEFPPSAPKTIVGYLSMTACFVDMEIVVEASEKESTLQTLMVTFLCNCLKVSKI